MSQNRPQPNNNNTGGDRFANYVPVAERIEKFHDRFPEGRILTTIVEHDTETGFILMRAEVYRNNDDAAPAATGHAFEVRGESYVNKTSYVENCETGSVGRALAMLGFEVKRGLASREEMQKVERMQNAPPPPPPARTSTKPQLAAAPSRAPQPKQPETVKPQADAKKAEEYTAQEITELDSEIRGLVEILGGGDPRINRYVLHKWETDSDWRDLSPPYKAAIKTMLSTEIDKTNSAQGGARS